MVVPIDRGNRAYPAVLRVLLTRTTSESTTNAHNPCRRSSASVASAAMTTPTVAATATELLSDGPLAGIRVLDLGTVYAAPITAMLLGDFGADVIKVEHPKGDPARTHGWNREGHGLWWKVISRNKRTVTLNFGKPEGQDVLRRLVAET